MLALAVQSRETGFAYVVIAGAAFLRADREARRILFWAVSGFAAPILLEMASFAAMFGDPLARYVIALHHTAVPRSEEHTSELQSLMRISYAVFCLKKKTTPPHNYDIHF